MNHKWLIVIVSAIIVPLLGLGYCFGGDLDDGISKFTDESISADDNLGKDAPNIKFIVLDALAKSKRGQKDDNEDDKDNKKTSSTSSGGSTNVNSVVVESGAKTGDIYNINIKK